MTRVSYDPEIFRLEVSGHAGAGAAGEDIVCAGISALTFAVINAATDNPAYMAHVYLNEREARIWLQCYPDEEHEALCREMFRTALHGYRAIREAFPEHIDLTGGYEDG